MHIWWSHLIHIKPFDKWQWVWFIWLLNNASTTRCMVSLSSAFRRQDPFSCRNEQKVPCYHSGPQILGLSFCSVSHPTASAHSAGVSESPSTWWAEPVWGWSGSSLLFLPHGSFNCPKIIISDQAGREANFIYGRLSISAQVYKEGRRRVNFSLPWMTGKW